MPTSRDKRWPYLFGHLYNDASRLPEAISMFDTALAIDGSDAPTLVSLGEAYLQHGRGTVVDRFGVWLSARQLRRFVPSFAGKRVGDFGCGYQASFARGILGDAASVVLVDVALADDLKADALKTDSRVRAIGASNEWLWPTIRWTPALRAAAIMPPQSSSVSAIGFSTSTCLPLRAARIA